MIMRVPLRSLEFLSTAASTYCPPCAASTNGFQKFACYGQPDADRVSFSLKAGG